VKQLWQMGGWMDAETALKFHYVNRITPLGEQEEMAIRFARQAIQMNLQEVQTIKHGIHRAYGTMMGLDTLVEFARRPHERPEESIQEMDKHMRIIHEHGMGKAVEVREDTSDEEITQV